MMRYLLFLACSLALVLVACGQAEEAAGPSIPLEDCRLPGSGREARCGVLAVPESRANPNGRTIDVNLAVVPATGSTPEGDPLFLLAGGPGQAGVEAYGGAVFLFDEINRTRDLVLIDQRGTGESGGLGCANLETDTLPDALSDDEALALIDDCRVELEARADLTQYTTEAAVADLDAIREALGYDAINLYGASYGSRLGLAYMRRHPERVRAAVLDAVVGPDLVLFRDMPRDGQRALDQLFARCAADAGCAKAFPDLEAEFDHLLAGLDPSKTVTIRDPLNNEPVELEMTRDRLMSLVFNLLYVGEFQSLVPLLVHHAAETGDLTPLVAQSLAVSESAALHLGLLYSVACAEDAPLIDPAEAEAIQAATDFPPMAESFLSICEEWPRGEAPADLREPLRSDIPTLLLSGDADPVTPPGYAATVAETLPNGRHLVVPGYGHGVIAAGCIPKVAAQFIREGSAAGLETACVDEIDPPPFFVSFAGPQP